MARLELCLLGPLVVILDGKPITAFESNKVRALLSYLSAEEGQPQRREKLAELLWPGWPQKSSLRNLSSALADLRKNTGDREIQPPLLLINRDSLQLNSDSDCRVDVSEFDRLLAGANRPDFVLDQSNLSNFQFAVSLYRGPFLEGFSLPDSSPFEEWLAVRREHYRRQVLYALRMLAGYHEGLREYEQALPYAYRQVEIEPWLEEAHQQIMRLLALNGQRSAALAQYETCCKLLKSELGVEPGVETVALYEQIRDGRLARVLPVPEPNRLPSQKSRPNLPLELTRFFGREEEIAQVKERLAEGRSVTLTGSGGVGKTRLSLRVIEEVQEDFPGGAWFVELASLSDPELVVYQVAVSLGLREDPSSPVLDTLKHSLESKVSLLVLDNCEHLLRACAGLADVLLRACPGLKILASSREPLGVAGEAIFRVPSLPFPDRGQALSAESIDRYDSVRLFVDRARQVLPGYKITAQNAASLAAICRRLDGIPLAIELAAARMNLLTVEELANHLNNLFYVLTGGSRTALPRLQTLQATIDWSYRLLSEKERLLIRRLAAFAGDWDLDGAEGVCSGAGLDELEVLDLLGSLVNKSMVTALRSQGSQTRYRMLEMVRQYVREKLFEAKEMEAVQHRHLAYFLKIAETAKADPFWASSSVEQMRRLAIERENFRLALKVGLEQDPQAGLRLASALYGFWYWINREIEGMHWLENYLRRPENALRNSARAHALWKMSLMDNLNPVSEKLAQESLEIFREIDDIAGQGIAQYALGYCLEWRDEYSAARIHYKAAVSIFEQIQDRSMLADLQSALARVAWFDSDVMTQIALLEKSLAMQRETGNLIRIARNLWGLGNAVGVHGKGDLRKGLALIEEGIAIHRQIRPPDSVEGRYSLALTLCWLGDYERVNQLCQEILEISRQSDDEKGFKMFTGRIYCLLGRLEAGSALMEQTLKILKESSLLNYVLNAQQTFILELAYALGCLGEIERANSWVKEFRHLFRAPVYQPHLIRVLGFLALLQGESQEAVRYFWQSLWHAQKLGRGLDALLALEGYAWALQLKSEPVQAATLLGAANEFRDRVGAQMFPRDRPMQEKVIAGLKSSLGDADYDKAWAEGHALGFERAIADVLAGERDSNNSAQ